jgi:peptidoglycan/LPS O-acetylase OafA/YrhL
MLVILGLWPVIAASKPGAARALAWYLVLLVLSAALGWAVHRTYSEPLNRALRSRQPGATPRRPNQSIFVRSSSFLSRR